jgi:hypothetical protein
MNIAKLDNPAQLLTASVFTFGANWLLNAIPPSWIGNIPYLATIGSVIIFILFVGTGIQIGHLIDFLISPERSIRGLFVELYDIDGESRIAMYSVTYSVSARKFAVDGIAFERAPSTSGAVCFKPHSLWSSLDVSLRTVNSKIEGLFYTSKVQRLMNREPTYPLSYTWINDTITSKQFDGWFSDFHGEVHTRVEFTVYRVSDVGPINKYFKRIFNLVGRDLRRFTQDVDQGAELLEKICEELLRRLRDKPLPGSNTVFESEGLSFPIGFVRSLASQSPPSRETKC